MSGIMWHRPLSEEEKLLHSVNNEGCCYISYVLRISSSREITGEDGRKVFASLYRKTPNLRLCVAERDGELWFREMPKEKIDFQVLEGADVNKTFHEITNYTLNESEGPMWAARLLPWNPCQVPFVEMTSSNDKEEGKHPNVCHVVIVYRHAITDGYSCMRIARAVVAMFSDVIAGNGIDDSTQIGTLLNFDWDKKEMKKIEQAFLNDAELLQKRKEYFASCTTETLFEKAYPVAPNLKPQTLCLQHVCDRDQTKKFISRCKNEGVTVHTAFCALVHAAIIRMLLDAGRDQDSYALSACHAADGRVYREVSVDELGVGMGLFNVTHTVLKEDALNHFWDSARKFHKTFKDLHQRKAALELQVIEKLTNFNPLVLLNKDGQGSPSKEMLYYATTNMRDITFLLEDCGDYARLEFLDRLTSVHLFPFIWLNTFHTLRGRFLHSLQYNVHLISTDIAERFSNILFDLLTLNS